MSATIKYKGNTIASITTDSSKTLKTSGKYCEGDIVVDNVQDGGITPSGNKAITATTSTQTGIDVTNYATVSVAPTPSETKSVTTNGDVTPSSGKLLSKVTVNVPTGTARDSSDLTVSGATVNVPAGLYSSAASKSVASGTAGTPTASKSAVSNNSVTVTPSVTNTEGYITGGTKTGTGVKVSASELVSGNKAITPSETAQSGIDVTNFKTASVSAISSTYVGSGVTKKAAATVAPSTSEQTVCASGVYTTGAQKVSAITPSIVGNLDASSFAAPIVAAVEGKGVTVPDGTPLGGMAALIESIGAGGGGGTEELSALLKIFGCSDYEISVVQENTAYPYHRINIPITNETLKSSLRFILIPGTNSLFPSNAIKKAPILRAPSMPELRGFFAYIWPYYSNPNTTHRSIISMLHVVLNSFVYDEGSSFTQDGTAFVFANNILTIHFNELSSKSGYAEYFFDDIIGTKVLLMGGNVQ